MKKIFLTTILLLILVVKSESACPSGVCYVRPDGGNNTQCTGGTDAAYPGSGSAQACAFKHPFYATGWWKFGSTNPPSGGQTGIIAGGDDVIIKSGSYAIGYSASEFGCSSSATYDCMPRAIPSGSFGNLTRIFGCELTGCSLVSQYPELWGTGRTNLIFDLRSKQYVELGWLNITDHAACGYNSSIYSCGSADAAELSARDGVDWTNGTSDILRNVKIHGVYRNGLRGSCHNCSILGKSHIDFNSFGGYDMDTCSNNGTCGLSAGETFTVTGDDPDNLSTFDWNGCVEDPSSPGTAMVSSCYNSSNGGFGDAFGGSTSSGTWNFSYVSMSHNTSDGLDLKYKSSGTDIITINHCIFADNAGNQVKTAGNVKIYNTIIEPNCGFFDGKSYAGSGISSCLSVGDGWNVNFSSLSQTAKFYGNTVVDMKGNVFVSVVPRGTCGTGNTVDIQNSVVSSSGKYSGLGGGSPGWSDISTSCPGATVTQINSNINGFSSNPSGSGNNFSAPVLSGTINSTVANAVYLSSSSPARDLSNETASGQPTTDYNSFSRGATYDSGALEYGSSFSGNPPLCGDNVKDSGEVCDGTDLNNQTCITQGFTSGTLACAADCLSFNTSGCSTNLCGNGNIDGNEQCDGVNLNGATCGSQGYSSCTGTPSCSSCVLTQGTCAAYSCGNGCTDPGEQCDDSNTTNGDGCSSICETEISGYEKFLTYTETDPNSHLTVATHKVTMVGINHNESANLKSDKGLNYFQNFTIKNHVQIDNCNDNGTGEDGGAGILSLAAASYSNLKAQEDAADGLELSLSCLSSFGQHTWTFIANGVVIASHTDSAPTISRYVKFVRSGTTGTVSFYSDSLYSNLLFTLTGTIPSTGYRYIATDMSYNSGVAGTSFSGFVENMNITIDAPPVADCTGQTINHCILPSLSNGQSGGACDNTGSCSYTCTAGNFVLNSNTCTSPPTSSIKNDHTGQHIGGCSF